MMPLSMRLKTPVLVVAFTGLLLFVAILGGVSRANSNDERVVGSTAGHGVSLDALDSPGPGVPLEDAIRRTGVSVTLPDPSIAGEVQKVALDETGADAAGHPGLLIRYSSGVKLMVTPREQDLSELLKLQEALPFVDGRKSAFESIEIDGHEAYALVPGTQVSATGARMSVEPRIVWIHGGATYTLRASATNLSVSDLERVARTMLTE